MFRPRFGVLGTLFVVLIVHNLYSNPAQASGAPDPLEEPQAEVEKFALLFPSVSEIDFVLEALDVRVDKGKLRNLDTAEPPWDELSMWDRKIQLGSLLGTLAIASQVEDLRRVVGTLQAILVGAQAIGIDGGTTSQKSIRELIRKAEAGTISKARLLASLDDVRREGLRDAAEVVGDAGLATILGASWLRGTSLLLTSTVDTNDPATLRMIFARQELITFISEAVVANEEPSAARIELASQLEAIAKKQEVDRDDLREFSRFAAELIR